MRFVFLALETSHGPALREAAALLRRDQGIDLQVSLFLAPDLKSEADWARLAAAIRAADLVFGALIFHEEYVRPLEPLLRAAACPVCMIMGNPSLIRCTHLGRFVLAQPEGEQRESVVAKFLKALRPKGGNTETQRQIGMLRGGARLLKYLPGKFRDIHSYVAAHQYWLNPSPENLRRMLCLLIERYVPGHKGQLPILDPLSYPEAGIWHPDAPGPFADVAAYERWRRGRRGRRAAEPAGRAALVALRANVLTGNTLHLAALVRAVEARGVEARVVYSAGLDARPALEQFVLSPEARRLGPVDLVASTTGFALVGGPAETRPDKAREVLEAAGVGYLDLFALVYQRAADWRASDSGLNPLQLALNVAVPELDSAAEPLVYAGPEAGSDALVPLDDQIALAAERIGRRAALRRKPNAEKRVAVVLFNYPPNLGNAGTAAYLDVFASLYRLLAELRAAGYAVELPDSADAFRRAVVEGNALAHGTDGNIAAHLPVEDYRRLFPHYAAIEPYWGPAPGAILSDGRRFQILGATFGNLFVGMQPPFGYERDPMRMLMSKDCAPNHGFAAFYTWIDKVFGADVVLHTGTHGALEFMPGKQSGLSADCWPSRLLGGLPNLYYYCVNNPSEGTIAKRRSAATLVSYMVPPVQHAGLYKGLRQLKDSIDQYRTRPDEGLLESIRLLAQQVGIAVESESERVGEAPEAPAGSAPPPLPSTSAASDAYLAALSHELLQVEERLIPVGLHVLGQPPDATERADILALVATFGRPGGAPPLPQIVGAALGYDYAADVAALRRDAIAQARYQRVEGICREAIRRFVAAEPGPAAAADAEAYLHEQAGIQPGRLAALWPALGELLARIVGEREVAGLIAGLSGGYIAASPGNDVVRNPDVVPTGRNLHGLDPMHIPSAQAQATAEKLVGELLARAVKEQGRMPESVAMVLWGTDNIKTEGEGVAQALWLMGARAVKDELGRIADVALVPLAELGRPRIDVVVTVSGIFRDVMSYQGELVSKAARLAAIADEPPAANFIRGHAMEQAAALGCPLEEAARRVFSNAPGSYGTNVNHLVESSTWEEEQQLSATFLARKSFALDAGGEWREARPLMERALSTVEVTFQNVDSVENGVSDIDHYYEYLGGVSKTVEVLRGARPTVLMAEVEAFAGPGAGRVRSIEQIVGLDSRAKLLNPRWFEGMLAHGYEGVRELELRVSNTYGWSATADAVAGWAYQGIADTYLLDEAMRERLAALNPHATAAIAGRLLEASSRGFWDADEATLEELRAIYADLEDRMEGVGKVGG